MIVACNLPSGLNLGFVTLAAAHREPGYQVRPIQGMVAHGRGDDGREFLGSYALTYGVDDLGFSAWAQDNAGSAILTSGAVIGASSIDELISKMMGLRGRRSHAQIHVPNDGALKLG